MPPTSTVPLVHRVVITVIPWCSTFDRIGLEKWNKPSSPCGRQTGGAFPPPATRARFQSSAVLRGTRLSPRGQPVSRHVSDSIDRDAMLRGRCSTGPSQGQLCAHSGLRLAYSSLIRIRHVVPWPGEAAESAGRHLLPPPAPCFFGRRREGEVVYHEGQTKAVPDGELQQQGPCGGRDLCQTPRARGSEEASATAEGSQTRLAGTRGAWRQILATANPPERSWRRGGCSEPPGATANR
ncbi:hypothetical protein AAFF_G00098930 [Aldrovandia affinis]|uniref:Uncharacterized protein n=1 Tax=Aldrovandia affinis TaxID=143900 RepID=A0AAD7WBV0_9TELE|nr:hypothetical protein AAFF_G00098930 [Aldrovandia affinis]